MTTTLSYSDRVDRLYAAKAKLEARLSRSDLDPAKAVLIEKRLAEYATSIDRIQKGLPENSTRSHPRSGGVVIGVPVDQLGMRE